MLWWKINAQYIEYFFENVFSFILITYSVWDKCIECQINTKSFMTVYVIFWLNNEFLQHMVICQVAGVFQSIFLWFEQLRLSSVLIWHHITTKNHDFFFGGGGGRVIKLKKKNNKTNTHTQKEKKTMKKKYYKSMIVDTTEYHLRLGWQAWPQIAKVTRPR